MPAEAVHLSALQDTLAGAAAPLAAATAGPALREAARLGAVFVDLPYFESFPRVLLDYVLKRPQRPSRWGDIFHQRTPIALGRALAESAAAAPWPVVRQGFPDGDQPATRLHPAVAVALHEVRAAALRAVDLAGRVAAGASFVPAAEVEAAAEGAGGRGPARREDQRAGQTREQAADHRIHLAEWRQRRRQGGGVHRLHGRSR